MESLEIQVERHWQAFLTLGSDLEKFRFAVALRQANLTLFHRFLADHIEAVMPIVYPPTVGAAIQRFSLDYRTPSGGVFLAAPDLERIETVLEQAVPGPVDFIVNFTQAILCVDSILTQTKVSAWLLARCRTVLAVPYAGWGL